MADRNLFKRVNDFRKKVHGIIVEKNCEVEDWISNHTEWMICSIVPAVIPLFVFIVFNLSHTEDARDGLLEFACFYFGISGPEALRIIFFPKGKKTRLQSIAGIFYGVYAVVSILIFLNLYMHEYDPTSNLLFDIPNYMRWIHLPGLSGAAIAVSLQDNNIKEGA